MAVSVVLSEIQRDTLRALCDTFVPGVDVPGDRSAFYARTASDLDVPDAVEQALADTVPEDELDGLRQLLDAIADEGFGAADPATREAIVKAFMEAGPESLAGMSAFKGLTLMLFYGMPDPTTGRNANWEAIGYPGPLSAPPDTPKGIEVLSPDHRRARARRRRVRGRLGGRRRRHRRLARGRASTSSCSRWAATSTRPTSTSSSCRPTRTSTSAAASSPPTTGSIGIMAGSNLGGGTDGQLDELHPHARRRAARSGSASSGSRAWPAPTTTRTSTRCGSASASTTTARTTTGRTTAWRRPARPSATTSRGSRATPTATPTTRRAPASWASATSRAPSRGR